MGEDKKLMTWLEYIDIFLMSLLKLHVRYKYTERQTWKENEYFKQIIGIKSIDILPHVILND